MMALSLGIDHDLGLRADTQWAGSRWSNSIRTGIGCGGRIQPLWLRGLGRPVRSVDLAVADAIADRRDAARDDPARKDVEHDLDRVADVRCFPG